MCRLLLVIFLFSLKEAALPLPGLPQYLNLPTAKPFQLWKPTPSCFRNRAPVSRTVKKLKRLKRGNAITVHRYAGCFIWLCSKTRGCLV